MVSPQKIKYNDTERSIHEILTPMEIILDVSFDSDNGTMSSYLNRSAVASESHDGRYKNTAKYKYDELFSPQFTIVKKDFSDFTHEEVRKVLKYLTSTDKPALLEVYYDGASDAVDWACIGGWTSIETYKMANSRIVGIVAQFEAIAPFAMSRVHADDNIESVADDGIVTLKSDNKITIDIDTDDNKPVYPRITINHGYNNESHIIVDITGVKQFSSVIDMSDYVENTVYKNGSTYYWKTLEPTYMFATKIPEYKDWKTVTVTRAYTEEDTFESNTFYKYNSTYYWLDPYSFHSSSKPPSNFNTTSVKITNQHYDVFGSPSNRVTTIVKNNTGAEKVVLDGANKIVSSDRERRIFGNDFNLQHLELYDGKNEITIEGNCEVTFEYRTVIKIGEY